MSSLIAIVMAAGHGTRMKSTLPKVLHRAAGRPLVYYPVKAALELGATRVVVVVNPATHEPVATALASELPEAQLSYAVQQVPQGTGDAARVGLAGAGAKDDDVVLVLSGDTPLLTSADLAPLTDALASGRDLAFLSFEPANPHGYGRVVRDASGAPLAIVEQKDLQGDSQRAIREVNAGMYAARAGVLGRALSGLTNENAQREYYLTDVVRSVAAAGPVVAATVAESAAAGVNQRDELARAEEILYARIRERLGKSGVTVVGRPLIDDSVEIEADALIDDGVRLRGRTRIGAGTHVDVGVVMDDATVGQRCVIKPYCVVSQSSVGDGVQMGPFAHLRPNSVLEDEVHVGNFVETKQTT
ncbi:MAG TPA: NTP transferase domain-containing protein, partial [Polyangiaceae bacterium]|nr:NTP transferase domain-containing protein [Polyangiaceae bacterium]